MALQKTGQHRLAPGYIENRRRKQLLPPKPGADDFFVWVDAIIGKLVPKNRSDVSVAVEKNAARIVIRLKLVLIADGFRPPRHTGIDKFHVHMTGMRLVFFDERRYRREQ